MNVMLLQTMYCACVGIVVWQRVWTDCFETYYFTKSYLRNTYYGNLF